MYIYNNTPIGASTQPTDEQSWSWGGYTKRFDVVKKTGKARNGLLC